MAKKKPNANQSRFDSLDSVPSMPEGYYTGDQPNPNLIRFVEANATPYEPETDDYCVRAFSQPITATKATAIYGMHTYWSKKPHDAIRQYILHYTRPGEIVLDPFCGSGGTVLASLIEGRKSIAIDRSPIAAFVTKNYCTPVSPDALRNAFHELSIHLASEIAWLYSTRCDRCGGSATTVFVVYSQVVQCPRCLSRLALFDCPHEDIINEDDETKAVIVCPQCKKAGRTETISARAEKYGAIPVLVSYICQNGCRPARAERRHSDTSKEKRDYFEQYDLGKIKEIEEKTIPYWLPPNRMMNSKDGVERWAMLWRPYLGDRTKVIDFFRLRNQWALAAILDGVRQLKVSADVRDALLFAFTGSLLNASDMYRYRESGKGGLSMGTFYVGPVFQVMNAWRTFEDKVQDLLRGYPTIELQEHRVIISTQSATRLAGIQSNSVDYVFTDPPYSWKVQYGESNFIWEAWLGFDTAWHEDEVIVNDNRGITEADWASNMKEAMSECYRVLKPDRWISLCYHDTSEGTWQLVQDIMAEAGFVTDRDSVAHAIDTGQKAWKQIVADKVSKRDLVVNYRKPKPLPFQVTKVYGPEDADKLPKDGDIATFADIARQIVRDFLTRHPGATNDRIYDELVSRLVASRSMEAHDFDALLQSVAEEVQQPVKEDLFRNKEPDLLGSHIQSRWYLKETADQVDQAEQAKEDSAANLLEKFIGEYLEGNPELEGVHYSDLFEQYLPVHDKPRRLLADWMPEYFIKTQSGSWRLPDKEEGKQLAELRKAGTIRRIKRFANALIDGVPVLEKDRSRSDVDLLDWLRQCRRAGLYEQGRAIYEKGGLNSANLSDEQQIEAEDDYRICVRRGSEEVAKPKRKSRKTKEDDE